MEFEWDEAKNASNIAKHGISFELAMLIFDGPIVEEGDDRFNYGERRMRVFGMIGKSLVLTVIKTERDGSLRLISARKASRKERKRYETALRQPPYA